MLVFFIVGFICAGFAYVTPVEELVVTNGVFDMRIVDHSYHDKFGYHQVYRPQYYVNCNGRVLETDDLAIANRLSHGSHKVAVNMFDHILRVYRVNEFIITMPIISGHWEPSFNVDRMTFDMGVKL